MLLDVICSIYSIAKLELSEVQYNRNIVSRTLSISSNSRSFSPDYTGIRMRLAYSDYQLNVVPRILSISLRQFRAY